MEPLRLACPQCHYDARPLAASERDVYRCPECGHEGTAAWIKPRPSRLRLVALACGMTAGMCVLCLLSALMKLESLRLDLPIPAQAMAPISLLLPVFVVARFADRSYERESWTARLTMLGATLVINAVLMGVALAVLIG